MANNIPAGLVPLEEEIPEGLVDLEPQMPMSYSAALSGVKSLPRVADDFMRGAADTMSFGFADEIAAGLGTGFGFLGDYDAALAQERARDAQGGGARLAGQVTGGLAGGLGLAKSGLSLGANAMQSGRLLPAVLGGATEGAYLGLGYGIGSGEGLEDRVHKGTLGMTTGAALGGIVPMAGKLVSSGAGKIKDVLSRNSILNENNIRKDLGKVLTRQMQADDTLGGRGLANIQAAGDDAMWADAGPTSRQLLDLTVQSGGPSARVAREAIEDRAARGSQKLVETLDDTLGRPMGIETSKRLIAESTQSQRAGTYSQAYNTLIDYDDPRALQIYNIVKNNVPRKAIQEANELMRMDVRGGPRNQIRAVFNDAGDLVDFEKFPTTQQLDYITRGLNQLAETGDGTGALGGMTQKGASYASLSREIRQRLRDVVPAYGEALDVAKDTITRSKGVDFGAKVLRPSTTRDEVAGMVVGASRAEKSAMAQGIRSYIDDLMANVERTLTDPNVEAREAVKGLKRLSSRASREKVGAIIGHDEAQEMFDTIDQVSKGFDMRAAMADNSKTFAREVADKSFDEMTQPGPVGKVLSGESPVRRSIQELTGYTPEAQLARKDEIMSRVAKWLSSNPQNAPQLMRGFEQVAESEASRDRLLQIMLRKTSEATPMVSYTGGALIGTEL